MNIKTLEDLLKAVDVYATIDGTQSRICYDNNKDKWITFGWKSFRQSNPDTLYEGDNLEDAIEAFVNHENL